MKTFCVLLLILSIAYVESEPHPCAKYAANTKEKPGTGEHDDQVIKLDDFVANQETQHFITKATPSEVDGSDYYCTPATHGSDCKAVGYWRIILKKPVPKSETGADELEFDAVIVAETGKGYAIKYEMTIKGVDKTDYIFQRKENTSIAAIQIDPEDNITNVSRQIIWDVLDVLRSEFALFYAKNGFSLYITCDAKAMWVEYDSKVVGSEEADNFANELNIQIKKLQDKVTAADLPAPQLADVDTEMNEVYKKHILKAET